MYGILKYEPLSELHRQYKIANAYIDSLMWSTTTGCANRTKAVCDEVIKGRNVSITDSPVSALFCDFLTAEGNPRGTLARQGESRS